MYQGPVYMQYVNDMVMSEYRYNQPSLKPTLNKSGSTEIFRNGIRSRIVNSL